MKSFFKRYTPLQIAIHIYAWSTLVLLIIDFFNDNLTANPIQALEQRTGLHAITLLFMALACTPLNNLLGCKATKGNGFNASAMAPAPGRFLMLVPLAFTSFDIWKKRLGKNWKRLHKLVYLIAPLAVLHFAWGQKGNFSLFHLGGNILRPLVYAVIVIILLIMRIPQVRKALASVRDRIRILIPFHRREPQPKADLP